MVAFGSAGLLIVAFWVQRRRGDPVDKNPNDRNHQDTTNSQASDSRDPDDTEEDSRGYPMHGMGTSPGGMNSSQEEGSTYLQETMDQDESASSDDDDDLRNMMIFE